MPHPRITPNTIILHDASRSEFPRWLTFTSPVAVITATAVSEIPDALRRVEAAVAGGCYAAGFLTYEAAPAFDAALTTHASGPLPLLWFGIYATVAEVARPCDEGSFSVSPWESTLSKADYRQAILRIKDYIAAGDTYQVNFTQRLHATFQGDPWAFFTTLCRAQQAAYCAYVDLGEDILCSASPELFFTRKGRQLTCKPMKGTAPRGLTAADDARQAAWLRASEKNRAENVMIVDMVRNDLGRIARPGSVQVRSLFDVERYATLWQMTSTVEAESTASLTELFATLYPCASITGAPKVRTCRIITELENAPRGIYTGSIGYLAPNGDAQFNVAIRTVHLDQRNGRLEYGTGGGITWDSTVDDEYDECRTKALVLTTPRPAFSLLETLLWKPESGYFLLERHLRRLADSAQYFGVPVDLPAIDAALAALAADFGAQRRRVRLLIDEDGGMRLESMPLTASAKRRWRVTVAKAPLDISDRFLYHKTTCRTQYEAARAMAPGYDDVILWNTRREVTESTIANVVIRRGVRLLTPAVNCGLLAGAYRDHLLASGRIEEAVITLEELAAADAVFLINSVRGWMPVEMDSGVGNS